MYASNDGLQRHLLSRQITSSQITLCGFIMTRPSRIIYCCSSYGSLNLVYHERKSTELNKPATEM